MVENWVSMIKVLNFNISFWQCMVLFLLEPLSMFFPGGNWNALKKHWQSNELHFSRVIIWNVEMQMHHKSLKVGEHKVNCSFFGKCLQMGLLFHFLVQNMQNSFNLLLISMVILISEEEVRIPILLLKVNIGRGTHEAPWFKTYAIKILRHV